MESISWYFFIKFRLFRFVLVCFGCFASIPKDSYDVSIEPKQTEDQPKQVDREQILEVFKKFRVVLVCFETVFGSFLV